MGSGQIYLVTATVQSQLVIRFVVCSRLTEESDVAFAWNEIRKQADKLEATTAADQRGSDVSSAAVTGDGTWPAKREQNNVVAVKALTHGWWRQRLLQLTYCTYHYRYYSYLVILFLTVFQSNVASAAANCCAHYHFVLLTFYRVFLDPSENLIDFTLRRGAFLLLIVLHYNIILRTHENINNCIKWEMLIIIIMYAS